MAQQKGAKKHKKKQAEEEEEPAEAEEEPVDDVTPEHVQFLLAKQRLLALGDTVRMFSKMEVSVSYDGRWLQ